MHIASALRRKRDEIVATIAAYEAKIDAARTDLAALDHAARLFYPESECDETALHPALRQLALPLARAKSSDDQDASLSESIGVRERQFSGEFVHPGPQAARGQIPGEFFYLDWP